MFQCASFELDVVMPTFIAIRRGLIGLLAALSFSHAASAATDGESVIAQFTDGLTGVDGRFEQRVWDADGQLKESSSGRVALAVPRQFRWEYQAPISATDRGGW
jgi:outer membrane lipoprotein carrier protein